MTMRLKIGFFLILLSVAGVIGASLLVLQKAIIDKRSYVTELNSVLAPQIKYSVEQKIQTLLDGIQSFAAQPKKAPELAGVDSLFLAEKGGKLVVIELNSSAEIHAKVQLAMQQLQSINSLALDSQGLNRLSPELFAFRTQTGLIGAVLLKSNFFAASFELARGKNSYLLTNKGEVFYQNIENNIAPLRKEDLSKIENNGVDVFSTEITNAAGEVRAANFARVNSIRNSFVLVSTPQISWQDLAGPLMNSSIWLILILIGASIGVAFSISGSLAGPIERLAEETARVGIGDWSSVHVDGAEKEIAKLAVAFNRMIANLKTRERELKVANNKLIQSESLAAVGRIGAGIAHEVKNPLASILSYCQLNDINLKSLDKLEIPAGAVEKLEKFKNYNKMIGDDTRRASRIISDLLTFARQKELQTSKIGAVKYVEDIGPKLKAVCDAAGIQFQIRFSDSIGGIAVNIDAEQIYQVLFNLVQNAAHAVASGDKPLKKIEFLCSTEENNVCFKIIDNGPGIPDENLSKIFEPFFSTKKVGEGSGLGLAICYGIILKHGGQIQVQSKIGEGSQFCVALPAA